MILELSVGWNAIPTLITIFATLFVMLHQWAVPRGLGIDIIGITKVVGAIFISMFAWLIYFMIF